MSTPYWGQLPPPQGRRLSQSSDQTDRRQSLDRSSLPQPRYSSNRASEQTNYTDAPTDSTYSPLASPTTSNAPGSGLTPRPPSLSYTQNQRHQELPENRARRTTRAPDDNTYRVANTSPLPAAPDAPKAHSTSYTSYYRNSGSPYTDRPADQYSLPHLSHRQDTQSNVVNMEPETFYKDATPPAERQARQPALDRAYQNFNDGVVSPEHLERELVRSGSIRRPPNGYRPDKRDPNSPRRRESLGPESPQSMWAADRSPLQKLELTLDSITKEEKRARVEAAERRARERAAKVNKAATAGERNQSLPERQAGQQAQVSNKDASIGGERSRHKSPASSSQAMPTAFIGHGVSPQNPSEVGTQYGIPVEPTEAQNAPQNREVSATTNGTPKRNLSFRERAATHERALPRESNQVTYPAAQTAAPHGGYPAPVRSGSNKLKKNPPGDPWYTVRREAEERSVQRSHSHYRRDAAPEDSYAEPPPSRHDASYATQPAARLTIDRSPPTEYARPPARGKTFGEDKHVEEPPSRIRELAAAIGFRRSNSMGSDQRPNLSESENTPILTGRNMQQSTLDGSVSHRQGSTISGGLGSASSLNQSRPIPAPTKALQGSQIGEKGTKSVKFQDSGHESGLSSDHLSDATHQRHHLREYLHHDGLKPGQGTYRAPVYLDEWKQGTVGLLSGPLLDLTQEPVQNKPIQTLDKNTPWWEAGSKRRASFSTQPPPKRTFDGANDDDETRTAFKPPIYLKCGPLLRYCGIRSEEMHVRMSRDNLASNKEIWRGSVMIVTQDSESSYDPVPVLRLFVQPIELLPPPPAEVDGEQPLLPEYVDPIAGIPKVGNQGGTLYVRPVDQLEEAKDLSMVEPDDGLFEVVRSLPDDGPDPPGSFPNRKRRIEVDGEKLGKYKDVRGFRLHAERGHTFWRFNIEIELRDKQQRIAYRINNGPTTGFWVPARGESMNIMFYSCNGFSQSVNPDDFSGPDPMWRDVLNDHQTRPFHVMIGGGDQVYNDAVANKAKLFREWIALKNPLHKTNAPFTPAMQDELEAFYLDRYMMWFSQGLFGLASSQIPMVNMYDDHDIIDGFGSYPHHFMKSPVFSGLGNVAFKYYLLFQHQSIPNETDNEPSWCLGVKPGPYINQLSRSLFVSLGARVSLLAVDARTERTRDEVVHPDTWGKLMDRCYEEIVKGKTQHLLVLLGVPIAYPRLVWLENILTSRLMDPIKALGKFGLLGNLVNSFDGGVEVLDDLDDHWTAKNHKDERRLVIEDLQDLAVDKSIRVTILSGDVHLAAVGQFYSNPKLRIPKHEDFRYMLNVISSAIANTPPPDLMADVLNKRNKVHHFDKETDEDMMPLFADGVDGKPRNNKHLLPHRNWCSIREYVPGHTPPPTPPLEDFEDTLEVTPPARRGSLFRRFSLSKERGPAVRPDLPSEPTDRSRPPLSGGFMRSFSRRGSVSSEAGRPESNGLMRTLSLGSRPRNLLRRKSNKAQPDDGGINGSWGDDDDDQDIFAAPPQPQRSRTMGNSLGLRGGAGNEYEIGDDAQFMAHPPRRAFTQPGQSKMMHTQQQPYASGSGDLPPPRPFGRTPTGLSVKKLKKHGPERFEVNTEGSLEVCLNVEVNPKDPAGITVPYRLLVPRLWYEYQGEGSPVAEPVVEQLQLQQPSRTMSYGPTHPQAHTQAQAQINAQIHARAQGQVQGQGHAEDRDVEEEGEEEMVEEPPQQKKVSGIRRWFSNRGRRRNEPEDEYEWDEEY